MAATPSVKTGKCCEGNLGECSTLSGVHRCNSLYFLDSLGGSRIKYGAESMSEWDG